MLDGTEIKVVESVLHLSNLIVFKCPELIKVNSEILVRHSCLFACHRTSRHISHTRLIQRIHYYIFSIEFIYLF